MTHLPALTITDAGTLGFSSCSPAAARAWRRLAPRLPLAFDLDGVTHVLDREAAEPAASRAWPAVSATADGWTALLRLDPALLPRAALQRLPELAQLGVPDGLRVLLLDVLLGELADRAAAWCGVRPAFGADALGRGASHLFSVRRAGRVCATLGLDDAGLEWLATRLLDRPPLRAKVDHLPVLLDLLVDRVTLAARELRNAGRGDVVLLDQAAPLDPQGGVAVMAPLPLPAAGIAGLRGRVLEGRFTLHSFLDGTMEQPNTSLLAGALDELPLPVEFLIGRLSLPLSRLQELAPGQVLDLGLDVTAAVMLRVNGQVVAQGELVRLAERTGVRITELHLARG